MTSTHTSSWETADTSMTNRQTETRAFFQWRMSERKMTDWGPEQRENLTLSTNPINMRYSASNWITGWIFFFILRQREKSPALFHPCRIQHERQGLGLIEIDCQLSLHEGISRKWRGNFPLVSKYQNQSEHRQWSGLIGFSLSRSGQARRSRSIGLHSRSQCWQRWCHQS